MSAQRPADTGVIIYANDFRIFAQQACEAKYLVYWGRIDIPPRMELNPAKQQERFLFIDALRGVAALAVLYHHMLHNSIMEVTLRRIMPLWATLISDWGKYGVQIFFVLSGFVITHSLRNSLMDGKSVLRFVIRRQLRLDPPYWCTIAFALMVQAVRLHFPQLLTSPLPGAGKILLNMLYLQGVTHTGEIVGVAWTLCIEIQFYVVFIAILLLATRLRGKRISRMMIASGLAAATGLLSLLAIFFGSFSVWFIQYWFFFVSGVLCYWSLRGTIDQRLFYVFMLAFAGAIVNSLCGFTPVESETTTVPAMSVGLGAVILIYLVGRMGRLTTLWSNSIVQYFGRISYSLYLVHLTVAVSVLQAGYKLTGENQKAALAWFALAGLASVLVGHLLYTLVERPALRFASTLRKRPSQILKPEGESPSIL